MTEDELAELERLCDASKRREFSSREIAAMRNALPGILAELRDLRAKTMSPAVEKAMDVFHTKWTERRLREARAKALEEAAKAVRDACKPMLTDRSAFIMSGPAGIVSAAVQAIRSLSSPSGTKP